MAEQGIQQTKHGMQPNRLLGNNSQQTIPEQTQVIAPPSQLAQRMAQSPQQLGTRDVAYLQRAIGNQAVAHLLKSPTADPAAPPSQAKLTVGPAHDRYEEEADRVAQSISGAPVQRASVSPSRSTPIPKSKVQRASDPQPFAPIGPQGGSLDAETGQTIRRAQGGGRPIDAQVRAPLEQKLNTDLSHARLHVDRQADDLNQRVGARAFTTGADIFVQRSEYQPYSKAGRALLYHELTHVHQQTGNLQRRVYQGAKSGVIQRELSGKSGYFSNLWGQVYEDTTRGNTSKKESEDYLAKFDSKPQDKTARKEQKQEEKQMKSLLHFGRKETDTTDENRRIIFRGILTAERARGQSMNALAELKQFMLDQVATVGDGNYFGMLNGKSGDIDFLVETAQGVGASNNLLNLFYTHKPNIFKNSDKKIADMTTKAPKLAAEATQLSSTSNKTALIRMRPLSKQMLDTLNVAKMARIRKDYIITKQNIDMVTTLYDTIWQLKTYASMGAKSNLSSENEVSKGKRLGGGQVGKVFEVNYDPTANTSIQHGVFKQERRDYDTGESPGASTAGIPEHEANFGARSVATSKLDKLMGLGMTPKTKFGSHEGMGGTVQDWAKGQSPQLMDDKGKTTYSDFDYDDPEIQRQLATLQIFDVITGQVDRHPGNYYISQGPGGTQVTAIDNDLAFGANKDVDRMVDPVWKDRALPFDHSRGIPLFLDEAIAEQILKTSAADLKKTISGMLSEAEVAQTLVRFAKVKTELRRKKANTARIKALQKRLDLFSKYNGKLDKSHPEVGDAIGTQVDMVRSQLAKAYGQGALLDRSEWGQKTAMYLNSENSYYGMVLEMSRMHRQRNLMSPVKN